MWGARDEYAVPHQPKPDRQMVVDRRPANGHWCDGAFGYGLFAALQPVLPWHSISANRLITSPISNWCFWGLAAFVFLAVSMLDAIWIRRLAVLMLIGAIGGVVLNLFAGVTVKGASRWLHSIRCFRPAI